MRTKPKVPVCRKCRKRLTPSNRTNQKHGGNICRVCYAAYYKTYFHSHGPQYDALKQRAKERSRKVYWETKLHDPKRYKALLNQKRTWQIADRAKPENKARYAAYGEKYRSKRGKLSK